VPVRANGSLTLCLSPLLQLRPHRDEPSFRGVGTHDCVPRDGQRGSSSSRYYSPAFGWARSWNRSRRTFLGCGRLFVDRDATVPVRSGYARRGLSLNAPYPSHPLRAGTARGPHSTATCGLKLELRIASTKVARACTRRIVALSLSAWALVFALSLMRMSGVRRFRWTRARLLSLPGDSWRHCPSSANAGYLVPSPAKGAIARRLTSDETATCCQPSRRMNDPRLHAQYRHTASMSFPPMAACRAG